MHGRMNDLMAYKFEKKGKKQRNKQKKKKI
jgi:hypothetical protein